MIRWWKACKVQKNNVRLCQVKSAFSRNRPENLQPTIAASRRGAESELTQINFILLFSVETNAKHQVLSTKEIANYFLTSKRRVSH